jgi:hypothetical protein
LWNGEAVEVDGGYFGGYVKPPISERIYLSRYVQESAWREDHRRFANSARVEAVTTLAMACDPSVDFHGYWQWAQKKA